MYKINNNLITEKRFDMAKFMAYADGFDIIDSNFINSVSNISASGTYIIRLEVSRPDLLSFNLYGDTQYWWLLMLYNDLSLPTDLVAGLEIKYFSIPDLETIYFSLGLP